MNTQEQELMRLATATPADGDSRAVLLVDLTGIPHADDPLFLRVLRKRLGAVEGASVESFRLPGHRLAIAAEQSVLASIVERAQRLRGFVEQAGRGTVAWTIYDLSEDRIKLASDLRRLVPDGNWHEPATGDARSLDPDLAAYMRLHEALSRADIANLVREQTIWSLHDDGDAHEVAHALSVDLDEIEVMFSLDIRDNPWLFDQVSELLDKRMFDHLLRDRLASQRRFSVDIHTIAVLNQDIDDYVIRMLPGERRRIVTELPYVEALNDEDGFWRAADSLRRHGFTLALDGVPWTSLPHLSIDPTRFDMVKIAWTPDLESVAGTARADIVAALDRIGSERAVLYHCDTEAAVETALSLGIHMVEGPGADGLVRNRQRDRNVASASKTKHVDPTLEDAPQSKGRAVIGRIFGFD